MRYPPRGARICLPALALTCLTSAALAQGTGTACATLDFEIVPGTTPVEGLVIKDQFGASPGLTFALEDGTSPHLAKVGAPTTAFLGKGKDGPAPGQNIGEFFLTDDGELRGSHSSPLLVEFAAPVDSASGVVLDIDYSERFTIEARDASGAVVETIVIAAGDPETGNGIATPWGFRRGSADVSSIRFEGTRRSGRFGLGFDNFTTCAVARTTPPETGASAPKETPTDRPPAADERPEPPERERGPGFVTGGGWFASPEGAYVSDRSLTGRASFGLVFHGPDSGHGASVEFRYRAGSLSFHSSRIDAPQILDSGKAARIDGVGTVSRSTADSGGEYRFSVWVRDAEPDEFRIRIQSPESETIYDTGETLPLGGGAIVIHRRDQG